MKYRKPPACQPVPPQCEAKTDWSTGRGGRAGRQTDRRVGSPSVRPSIRLSVAVCHIRTERVQLCNGSALRTAHDESRRTRADLTRFVAAEANSVLEALLALHNVRHCNNWIRLNQYCRLPFERSQSQRGTRVECAHRHKNGAQESGRPVESHTI